MTAQDDYFIAKGETLLEQQEIEENELIFTQNWDIYFDGMDESVSTDLISVKDSNGEKEYELTFTNVEGRETEFPIAYASGESSLRPGDANNILQLNNVMIAKNQYFILNDDNDEDSVTNVVQYKGADDFTASEPKVKFKILATGETLERPVTFSYGTASATLTLSGTTYVITNTSPTDNDDWNITVTGGVDTSTLSGTTKTNYVIANGGTKIQLIDPNINAETDPLQFKVLLIDADAIDDVSTVPYLVKGFNIRAVDQMLDLTDETGVQLTYPEEDPDNRYGWSNNGAWIRWYSPPVIETSDQLYIDWPEEERLPFVYLISGEILDDSPDDNDGDGLYDYEDNCPYVDNSGLYTISGEGEINTYRVNGVIYEVTLITVNHDEGQAIFEVNGETTPLLDAREGYVLKDKTKIILDYSFQGSGLYGSFFFLGAQKDTDGDGIGDDCDADDDNDAILDTVDNCPLTANAGQEDADGDGIGNVCDSSNNNDTADSDNDGIKNNVDNCPLVVNANQADKDNDNIGDVCDSTDNTPIDNTTISDEEQRLNELEDDFDDLDNDYDDAKDDYKDAVDDGNEKDILNAKEDLENTLDDLDDLENDADDLKDDIKDNDNLENQDKLLNRVDNLQDDIDDLNDDIKDLLGDQDDNSTPAPETMIEETDLASPKAGNSANKIIEPTSFSSLEDPVEIISQQDVNPRYLLAIAGIVILFSLVVLATGILALRKIN